MSLSFPERWTSVILGLNRMVFGLLFACHGAATLFGVLGGPHGGHSPELFAWPSWWAAAIQLVGGALVLVGLGTRPAALLCSGSMAYAYFVVHQPEGLWPLQNGGEPSAMYCWAFLAVAAVGPGAFSLDGLLAGRGGQRQDDPLSATMGRRRTTPVATRD
ncbi:DoxX family protein [Allostreptomyces psammosilenae]|uniref:Putative oxidoreductase n=1 Tax=Allostreptomyces psammosilenae TaxID=1892865 RepID=A0A852ZMG7_9ACTN|nr:DoxX family protein [Allostreptomyces psammosilenae]NYI03616.1 putative oxidoreductase [Allostreptomyces psammosilenae]